MFMGSDIDTIAKDFNHGRNGKNGCKTDQSWSQND